MKTFLTIILFVPILVQSQNGNYFPINVGTTWVYKLNPQYSTERERLTITRDSISLVDSSHFIFINNNTRPSYRVDPSGNVFYNPFSKTGFLIFKQNANKLEAWRGSDSSKGIYRIKDVGLDFVLGKWRTVKIVEWGTSVAPDTFGMSTRSEYYCSDGIGLYFVIVEPPSTERLLIGFISGKDTLGDITSVPKYSNRIQDYSLSQNYPNPFNPTTRIEYFLPKETYTKLKLYDILGREIQSLVSEVLQSGNHSVELDGTTLSSGIYFYKLQSGDYTQTKKLLLQK